MNIPEKFVTLHRDKGLNCSQALLAMFGNDFGLPAEQAAAIAAGFGGGMGRMGSTCGAVTGSIMVLGGLTYSADNPNARPDLYALVNQFRKRFIARQGSVCCQDLLGCDISTDEGYALFREQNFLAAKCRGFGQCAAEIIGEMMAERNSPFYHTVS